MCQEPRVRINGKEAIMAVSSNYLLLALPEGLEGLAELALDLRWSWNHAADKLWKYSCKERAVTWSVR